MPEFLKLIGFSSGSLTAMILLKTNNNQETLSLVLSVGAIGGVIGSLAVKQKSALHKCKINCWLKRLKICSKLYKIIP
jgi:hypothetical protein